MNYNTFPGHRESNNNLTEGIPNEWGVTMDALRPQANSASKPISQETISTVSSLEIQEQPARPLEMILSRIRSIKDYITINLGAKGSEKLTELTNDALAFVAKETVAAADKDGERTENEIEGIRNAFSSAIMQGVIEEVGIEPAAKNNPIISLSQDETRRDLIDAIESLSKQGLTLSDGKSVSQIASNMIKASRQSPNAKEASDELVDLEPQRGKIVEMENILFRSFEVERAAAHNTADVLGVLIGLKPAAMIDEPNGPDCDRFIKIMTDLNLHVITQPSEINYRGEIFRETVLFLSRDAEITRQASECFAKLREALHYSKASHPEVPRSLDRRFGELMGYPSTAVEYFLKRRYNNAPLGVIGKYYAHSPEHLKEEKELFDFKLDSAISRYTPRTHEYYNRKENVAKFKKEERSDIRRLEKEGISVN